MIKSEIIEIDGVFVGVVIQSRHDGTRVFRAIHEWLRPLNGQIMTSLQDARTLAAGLFRRQRVVAAVTAARAAVSIAPLVVA